MQGVPFRDEELRIVGSYVATRGGAVPRYNTPVTPKENLDLWLAGENTTEEEIRACVDRTVDELAPGGSWVAMATLKTKSRNPIVTDELIRYGSTKYTSKRPEYDSLR